MDKDTLIWEIISIGPDLSYKTLNPRNSEELKYGLENDILQCNKNTLITEETQEDELWNSMFN